MAEFLRNRWFLSAALAISISGLILSGCHHASNSSQQIRVALSKDPISWLPVRLAKKFGYYQKEDLAVSFSEVTGLSKGMEALLGGSVEVTAGAGIEPIQMSVQGRSVRSFLTFKSIPSFAIVISPSSREKIRTLSDLKGRVVGVSSLGSPTQWFLNYVLAAHRMKPEDVSVVAIGTAAPSVIAVEHGQVDAAVLISNAISVLNRKHPNLTFLADPRTPQGLQKLFGVESYPTGILMAQESWIQRNSDVVRRFAAAVVKGMQWVASHSAEEVRAEMSEAERMPDAEADLQAIRDFQHGMIRDGMMPSGGPEILLKVLMNSDANIRITPLTLKSLYTNEFVNVN